MTHECSCFKIVCKDCHYFCECLLRWVRGAIALLPVFDMISDIVTLCFYISLSWVGISTGCTLIILGQWRFTVLLTAIHPNPTLKNIVILYVPFAWLWCWTSLHKDSQPAPTEQQAADDDGSDDSEDNTPGDYVEPQAADGGNNTPRANDEPQAADETSNANEPQAGNHIIDPSSVDIELGRAPETKRNESTLSEILRDRCLQGMEVSVYGILQQWKTYLERTQNYAWRLILMVCGEIALIVVSTPLGIFFNWRASFAVADAVMLGQITLCGWNEKLGATETLNMAVAGAEALGESIWQLAIQVYAFLWSQNNGGNLFPPLVFYISVGFSSVSIIHTTSMFIRHSSAIQSLLRPPELDQQAHLKNLIGATLYDKLLEKGSSK